MIVWKMFLLFKDENREYGEIFIIGSDFVALYHFSWGGFWKWNLICLDLIFYEIFFQYAAKDNLI